MNKWFLSFLVLFSSVATSLTHAQLMDPNNPVVIEVGSEVIYKKDLDQAANEYIYQVYIRQAQQTLGRNPTKEEMAKFKPKPQDIEKARPAAIQQLIQTTLLRQEALKTDVQVDPKVVDAEMDYTIKGYGGQAKFEQMLKTKGMTLADAKQKIKEQMMVLKLTQDAFPQPKQPTDAEFKSLYKKLESKLPKNDSLYYVICQTPSTKDLPAKQKEQVTSIMKNIETKAGMMPFDQACNSEYNVIQSRAQIAGGTSKTISKTVYQQLAKLKATETSKLFTEDGKPTLVHVIGKNDGKWESYKRTLYMAWVDKQQVQALESRTEYFEILKEKFPVKFHDTALEGQYKSLENMMSTELKKAKSAGAHLK